jgi:probable rRNA maturation factor
MKIDRTPRSRTRNAAISVDVVRLGRGRQIPVRNIKATARRILEVLDKDLAELSIALVGNEQIQALNAEYRAKNEPTDVLSFPVNEMLANGMLLIGDVVISVEKAAIQAQQRHRNLDAEIASLLIHGILHNLGYDHERSPDDERVMKAMERKVGRALR